MKTLIRCVIAALTVLAFPIPDARAESSVVNIVSWEGGRLLPVYERSDQLPLSAEDILRLSRNGFAPQQIVRMIQERRVAGDASADGLIALKKAGVAPEVLQAFSLHALPPNRALNLSVELSFEGVSREARRRYLYVILPDGPRERVFTADLGAVLSGHWSRDVLVDRTDPLLPRQIRRITFSGEVPLKTYGQKSVLVFTSTRPDIIASADIPGADRPGVQTYTLDYPASSLRRDCLVQIRYKQDVAVPYQWHMVRSKLQCEWN
ncbi:MAG: hypothetical protein EXS64_19570 [Candidatus Latescibacteria bacterium]|nr:hypothetical protein [Candidatus Latescibacterota bacterium]